MDRCMEKELDDDVIQRADSVVGRAATAARLPIFQQVCDPNMVEGVKQELAMRKGLMSMPKRKARSHAQKSEPQVGGECWNCGGKFLQLKTCSGCAVAKYCSSDCQKQHWKKHKTICKTTKGDAKK